MKNSLSSFWQVLDDPHKFLAKIDAGRSTSDYAKNSDVFVQGKDAHSIFYLQEGRVKVTVTSEQGEEATVAILQAGHFFGDGCLGGQTHRIVTTKALTDCRITVIEKASMIKALEDQPWFNFLLIICITGIVESKAMSWIGFLVRVSSGSRVSCWKK